MGDFVNTAPLIPHRFDAETVQRFREHEADDSAPDYAAGSDDYDPSTGGWADWLIVAVVLAACLAVVLAGGSK
jgi:hypothetical protein